MSGERPGEFELIARHFAPLARGFPGAHGLKNDIAVLAPPPGYELIVKTDAVVAGVHFLPGDAPDLVARKALRVNLSDIAAGGGSPYAYQMALALAPDWTEDWVARFCAGLAADQREFNIHLCGGDTVATPGPATVSITAFGLVPRGAAMAREGAKAGDDIWVTGTIGDAALGLRSLRGALPALDEEESRYLADRYRLPRPRLALAPILRDVARASIDVSDGLVADLGHVCAVSGVGAAIEATAVPLSPPARRLVGSDPALLTELMTAGDDYEILFTATNDRRTGLEGLARQLGFPLTRLGRIVSGGKVSVLRFGQPLAIEHAGFRHF
ncbi:MAG: thiamine-phosphate kinase [Reyranellaceae bacterium]